MVYLRYQTSQTPSLANALLWTTPLWTPFLAPLHGILPRYSLLYTTYTYNFTPSAYLIISWSLQARRLCIKNLHIVVSVIWCNCCHLRRQFCAGHHFRLDSNQFFWFVLNPGAHICFRFYSHNPSPVSVKIHGVPYRPEWTINNNSEIVEYSRILKTRIGFGEDALFFQRVREKK